MLHKLSFIEDPTRILRAVRFAERYRFKLTKETLEVMDTALEHGVLRRLSRERFTQELLLIYREENYRAMGLILLKCGILKEWFGEELPWEFSGHNRPPYHIDAAPSENENDLTKPCKARKSTFTRTSNIEHRTSNKPLVERWLLSLSRFDALQAETALERLRLPRNLQENTRLYFRCRGELEKSSLDLLEIDRLLNKQPQWLITLLACEERLTQPLTKYLKAIGSVSMSVDGNTLREAGIKEGVRIGQILHELREAWLLGEIHSQWEEEMLMWKLIDREKGKG